MPALYRNKKRRTVPTAADDVIAQSISISDGDVMDGIYNFTMTAIPVSGPVLTDREADEIDGVTSVIDKTAAKADAARQKDYAKVLRLALHSIRNLNNRMSRMTPMSGTVYEEGA